MMITLEAIKKANTELPPVIRRTPLLLSEELSEPYYEVFLKCENLQVTGSYKARAAFTILNRLSMGEMKHGAALSSSGNFASAFAYMARLLGVKATIVMMPNTSQFKQEKTRRYGGNIVFCEDRFEARFEEIARLQKDHGIIAINHLEDPNVIIGHGTLGVEIVEQLADVSTVLVPISTGGLIAGVATAIKALLPRAKVIGVQPEGSSAMYRSFQERHVVRLPRVDTVCDALTAEYPGTLMFEHARRVVDSIVLVRDEAVKESVIFLARYEKLIVEPGGAVTVAAIRSGVIPKQPGKTVAILSGGNVALDRLSSWLF